MQNANEFILFLKKNYIKMNFDNYVFNPSYQISNIVLFD